MRNRDDHIMSRTRPGDRPRTALIQNCLHIGRRRMLGRLSAVAMMRNRPPVNGATNTIPSAARNSRNAPWPQRPVHMHVGQNERLGIGAGGKPDAARLPHQAVVAVRPHDIARPHRRRTPAVSRSVTAAWHRPGQRHGLLPTRYRTAQRPSRAVKIASVSFCGKVRMYR